MFLEIKKQKSYIVVTVLVFFIIFLISLFSYLQVLKRTIKYDYTYKQSLIKLYDYNQNFNDIFINSYRDIDNDKASEISKKFDKVLAILKSNDPIKQSDLHYKYISIIEKKYHAKMEFIEEFKTLDARIINASYYLDTLKKGIFKEEFPLAIKTLIQDVVFQLGQVFIGKIVDISIFDKNILALKNYKTYSESMKYFYMHTRKLTEDIVLLQTVLKEQKMLNLKKSIYKMHKLLRLENSNNKAEENIISIIFFLFSFVGILVLIYSYLRILTQKEEMYYLAYHDALTTLPNRVQFEEYINKLINSKTKKKHSFILLFIDLDRFKVINDTLGHDIGDEILIIIAKRIYNALGKKSFIARLGGDEFIAIIENITAISLIEDLLESLVIEIRKPLLIREYSLNITSSIGVVKYPEDGNDKSTLLKYADSAMYHAKALGKDRYAFYNTQLSIDMHRRLEIEQELVSALKSKEFSLVFQPQYCLKSEKITGAEALVRWKSDWLGHVSPEEFISIAEDIGLIIELGYYIFKEACEAYMDWERQGVHIGLIAINISSVQLRQHDAFQKFVKIIEETGIDPHNIEIELTERYIMEYTTEKLTILDEFRAIGCQISIDDFGTGYSSMSYLKSLAIDTIKIDKSFVGDLVHNQHDSEVSKAIIVLSQTLGYKVIAEGIETEEQEKILSQYNCDMGQGYYFSKPLSSERIVRFYHEHLKKKSK